MIMENFYHPRKEKGHYVPAVLGLTASPVMKADPRQLVYEILYLPYAYPDANTPPRKIEANLDAIARTPVLNREELMKYVHVPKLKIVYYGWDPIAAILSSSKSPSAAQPYEGTIQAPHKTTIQPPDKPVTGGWAKHLDLSQNLDLDLGEPFRIPGFVGLERANAPSKPNTMSTEQVDGRNKRSADQSGLSEPPSFKRSIAPKPASHDEDYESIDPLTSEPVAEDYDDDHALTSEPVAEDYDDDHALMSEPIAEDYDDDDDDEFECIDPVTLEVVSPQQQQTTQNHQGRHFERIPDDVSDDCEEVNPEIDYPVSRSNIPEPTASTSRALESLRSVYGSMDIRKDPYILKLQSSEEESKRIRAINLIATQRTYCHEQIRQLVNKATHLLEEYGEWAADWFIREAIQKFQKQNLLDGEELSDLEGTEDNDESMSGDEHQYLVTLLRQVSLPDHLGPVEDGITPKVKKLIEILLKEYDEEKSRAQGEFSALVFVEQRVGVLALAEIIKIHPKTKAYLRPGTMVGSSGFEKCLRFLRDLTGKNQDKTLDDFREGKRNLIVATSVIEEGLDIQDCHLVVCFYPPRNLKSFVQRRGRARRVESSYIIMYKQNSGTTKAEEFEALEKEMVKTYSDPLRELGDPEEEVLEEEGQDRKMRIETTG